MADAKLTELTAATLPASGSDLLYLVQGTNSRKITLDNLNASAANVNMKSKVQLGSATSTVSSAGASIPVTATVTFLNSTDGPGRIFIPAGSENQIKVITMTVYGGDYWISSNIANEANILFGNVGDTAIFIYSNNKWNVMGRNLTGVTQYVSLATSNVLTGGAGISIAANGLITATETGTVSSVFGQTSTVSNAQLACAVVSSAVLNTSNVVEGSNLYFTNTRVVSALTAGSGVNIAANGRVTVASVIPGPYADDSAAATAGIAVGSPYYQANGQVFVRLT
jgi:hypothetical protein